MKCLVIYFEDDALDLSAFGAGMGVSVSTSAIKIEGGKVFFQTTPLAEIPKPVPEHAHVINGSVTGVTGPPE